MTDRACWPPFAWLTSVVLFVLSWLAPCSLATASPVPYVELSLAEELSSETALRLGSAIGGQLADVAQIARAPSATQQPLCRVRIDPRPGELLLSFSRLAGDVGSTRAIRSASEELEASEVASVVRAYVVALLEPGSATEAARLEEDLPAGEPAEVAQQAQAVSDAPPAGDDAPPPATPQEIPVPERVAARPAVEMPALAPWGTHAQRHARPRQPALLWLTALYSGTNYAAELPWQHGTRLEVALRLLSWLHAGLGYGWHPPAPVEHSLATVQLRDHALYALGGAQYVGAGWAVGGDIAVGITRTGRETTRAEAGWQPARDTVFWGSASSLRLRGRLRVPRVARLWLELAPALELATHQHEYRFAPGAWAVVLTPNSVRARLDVGLSFELL